MKKHTYPEQFKGHLIIIGGAEDKENERYILRKFVALAGGKEASILIVPVASDFPEFAADVYLQVFKKLDISSVSVLRAAIRSEVMDVDAEALFQGVTGVFITGGDQMRLASVLGGTDFARELEERVRGGVVLAGSSAGAAGMSAAMIVRGESALHPHKEAIRLSPGLGILQNIIIDQHFTERGRLSRLITAVSYNPKYLGIGIDENTAIIISQSGILEVAGAGTVTIIDGSEISYNDIAEVAATQPFSVCDVRLHILRNGLRYDLFNRETMEVTADLLPG